MAELQPIPIGVQAYESRSRALRIELVENLYAEKSPGPEKGPVSLVGTPGLSLFATIGDGPIRGMTLCAGVLFVVSGSELYWVTSTGNANLIGTVDGVGPVQMVANNTQVAITTSGLAYAADTTQIAALPVPNLIATTYQDGYALFLERGTENLYWSALDNMFSLSSLNVTQADALPDNGVGLISDHREVWFFGTETTEVFVNTGNAASPFVRTGGGFIEHGCAATHSVAKAENMVFWLGDDGRVYSAQGYAAKPISTPAIEYALSLESSLATVSAYTYGQEGHTFYVLNLAGGTYAYDITTGLWHRRRSYGLDRWRVGTHIKFGRKQLVGDYSTGALYELDFDMYTENSEPLVRVMHSPPLYASGKRILLDELVVDLETGVGLISGQGSDPKIMLDWTDDFGHEYSNERWRSIGKAGEYKKLVRWYGCGSFRNRAYRLSISDPVRVRILGVYGRMEAVES